MTTRPLVFVSAAAAVALLAAGCSSSLSGHESAPAAAASATFEPPASGAAPAAALVSPPADPLNVCQYAPALHSAVVAVGEYISVGNLEQADEAFYFIEYWTTSARELVAQSSGASADAEAADLAEEEKKQEPVGQDIRSGDAASAGAHFPQLAEAVASFVSACNG